jgi:hypothetical protein
VSEGSPDFFSWHFGVITMAEEQPRYEPQALGFGPASQPASRRISVPSHESGWGC